MVVAGRELVAHGLEDLAATRGPLEQSTQWAVRLCGDVDERTERPWREQRVAARPRERACERSEPSP